MADHDHDHDHVSAPLPVAELHLHLDGTLEPDFIMETAARNGVDLPWKDLADLESRYAFTDLQSFLDLLYVNLTVLRTREDFAEMTRRYLVRAAAAGVRHAEVSCDVQAHVRRGIPAETVVGGIRDVLDRSVQEHGVSTRLIVSFWRDAPVDEALGLLRELLETGARFDGIGLDSAEVGYPPALFSEVFDLARAHGLHVVAHAGRRALPTTSARLWTCCGSSASTTGSAVWRTTPWSSGSSRTGCRSPCARCPTSACARSTPWRTTRS
ncbi:hypothetical protein GCM10025865_18170 [Paraoerskovia sediminicola]|uniref:Adenosine deaminase domain-containing protein n=1 Tax=Paraoerskovia sediminicola TaxID=1138587 RepID=A0ABN6XGA6_9CELL|nr:hypothetical protein GCM10025865_18170 [Paraoerskovia sediminicola]